MLAGGYCAACFIRQRSYAFCVPRVPRGLDLDVLAFYAVLSISAFRLILVTFAYLSIPGG